MFDLTGKSALVTRASGGIGAEIARALHGAADRPVVDGHGSERARGCEEAGGGLTGRHALP